MTEVVLSTREVSKVYQLEDQLITAVDRVSLELYRGEFLEGFSLRDSASFDEWQFFETEGLRQALASALERLVRGHTDRGEFERAIAYARRWLALDPMHEPAHCCLKGRFQLTVR